MALFPDQLCGRAGGAITKKAAIENFPSHWQSGPGAFDRSRILQKIRGV
jgi:hypothetical protein